MLEEKDVDRLLLVGVRARLEGDGGAKPMCPEQVPCVGSPFASTGTSCTTHRRGRGSARDGQGGGTSREQEQVAVPRREEGAMSRTLKWAPTRDGWVTGARLAQDRRERRCHRDGVQFSSDGGGLDSLRSTGTVKPSPSNNNKDQRSQIVRATSKRTLSGKFSFCRTGVFETPLVPGEARVPFVRTSACQQRPPPETGLQYAKFPNPWMKERLHVRYTVTRKFRCSRIAVSSTADPPEIMQLFHPRKKRCPA